MFGSAAKFSVPETDLPLETGLSSQLVLLGMPALRKATMEGNVYFSAGVVAFMPSLPQDHAFPHTQDQVGRPSPIPRAAHPPEPAGTLGSSPTA